MIPNINGTQNIMTGNFVMDTRICYCAGKPELFAVLEERLRRIPGLEALTFAYDSQPADTPDCSITLAREEIEAEAYRLSITERQVTVAASGDEGFIWGLTTLFALLQEGAGNCPCQTISDAPLYRWRGFHMDCARHFFDKDTVLLMIELASRCKMNRLHWHISDDQGYRLESRRFPKLNSVGSWRTEADGSRYGGFYTAREVAEIVSYAKVRGIEIVPEIDLPGHVTAILAAYPEFGCNGTPLSVAATPGIFPDILCGGRQDVLDFVCELLDEVAAMFPFRYFHIGGDEAPKDRWESCPHCQAKIRELGLGGAEDLQAHFSGQIAAHLKKLGKTAICWNDSLKSSALPEDICIQYWDEEGENPAYCQADAAFARRDWIYSFTPCFYFDYAPALTPLRKAYHFQPVLRAGTQIPEEHLLGIECELWSEQFSTRQELLERAFPRMYAVAERGWCPVGSYEDFKSRAQALVELTAAEGVQLPSAEDADPSGEVQKQRIIAGLRPMIAGLKQLYPEEQEKMRTIIPMLLFGKIGDQFSQEDLADIARELEL